MCLCRYQFKAKPINSEIFSREGLYGVPMKRTADLTKPVTPDLSTKRVMQKRGTLPADKEVPKKFRARPMPDFKEVRVSRGRGM